MSIKILLIDNYDSFVFNAHHLFQEADPSIQVDVVRNDDDFLSLLDQGKYHGVIVGPGPGSPEDDAYFGHSKQVILEYPQKGIPVLGISWFPRDVLFIWWQTEKSNDTCARQNQSFKYRR